jgi:hypothetical protein
MADQACRETALAIAVKGGKKKTAVVETARMADDWSTIAIAGQTP